jgi:TetR/AcrR family transcriptional regulator, regulator of cefoperazone and chloramphenicol sensitivity
MNTSARAEETRHRLLQAALRLFAHQGFSKTSTRELAEAAQANIAAISYHFGDKAGLYRAAFFSPNGQPEVVDLAFADAALPLEESLHRLYTGFLAPMAQGEEMQLCMRLHFREMVEPTGLWQEEITHGIAPMHAALLQCLLRHLGPLHPARRADTNLQRLALCITGLAVHLHVGRDVVDAVAPGLMDGEQALQEWTHYLTRSALALVEADAEHRRQMQKKPTQKGNAR